MTDDRTGFVHQAGLYDGEEGLLSLVVPFVEEGIDAGEPVVIALDDPHAAKVKSALPRTSEITMLPSGYARPATTVSGLLELMRGHAASRPGRIRIVGELAVGSLCRSNWSPWARYEAAVNALFASFPATTLCAYDTTATPEPVLDDIRATHPWLSVAGDTRSSDRFTDPLDFLAGLSVPRDPLQDQDPVLELADPEPAAARNAVHRVAARCAIDEDVVNDFVLGVNEVVTNALVHGRPPVALRLWSNGDRMLAVVSDGGTGPTQPFAGLVSMENPRGGRGLWMTHQVCGQVDHLTGGDGFAVRLATAPPDGSRS